jgi:hypothetical protein
MKKTATIVGTSFLAVIMIIGSIFYLESKVAIILPVNFRGLIRISLNDHDSEGIERGFFTLSVRIPMSGELNVKTLAEFRKLRRYEVHNENGMETKQAFLGSSQTGIKFWHLNSPPKEQVYFFVGTFDEMDAFLKSHEQDLYSK